MPRFDTVIFDVDGTIVDSNAAHARAWTDALAESGREIPYDRVRMLIGMGADNLLPTLLGISKESDEGSRLASRASEIFNDAYLESVRPFPRVRELIEKILSEKYKAVVASSANEDALGNLLEIGGVSDLLELRVSATDVHRSKPEPDCVVAALRKADTLAGRAVMIGDTPYDVAAALRADVQIIGLRSGGWDTAQLAGAIAVYDDPSALLSGFAKSPLAHGPLARERRRSAAARQVAESSMERRA
jgi:phosphoglycolate phosphatase-like HAD superfamily hydrolase